MLKPLTRFSIAAHEEGYLLRLETEDGEPVDILASFDQLDLLSEEIDRRLDEDSDQALPLQSND
jgi:hypothetical protein